MESVPLIAPHQSSSSKLDRLLSNGSRHTPELSIRLRPKDILGGRQKTSPFSAGDDLF